MAKHNEAEEHSSGEKREPRAWGCVWLVHSTFHTDSPNSDVSAPEAVPKTLDGLYNVFCLGPHIRSPDTWFRKGVKQPRRRPKMEGTQSCTDMLHMLEVSELFDKKAWLSNH